MAQLKHKRKLKTNNFFVYSLIYNQNTSSLYIGIRYG